MRIFLDPVEMIKEVERDLFEMGLTYQSKTVQDMVVENDKDFETLELFGYAYTLVDYKSAQLKEMLEYTNSNIEWAIEESNERLNAVSYSRSHESRNPGEAWKTNKRSREFWGRFIRNGLFSYSYAERWGEQLPYVINELKHKPESRHAIMTMYSAERDIMKWGGIDRVPCSLTYQFVIREGSLKLIYNQRSCDFLNFFACDVFFGVKLLQYVARKVQVYPGDFIHYLGSMHAFKGDMDKRNIF